MIKTLLFCTGVKPAPSTYGKKRN